MSVYSAPEGHSENFDVRPFAAGTVRGIRSFRRGLGYCGCSDCEKRGLRAVSADYTWMPGENVAECQPVWPLERPHEQVAGAGCTCGFYAYLAASDQHVQQGTGRVVGIVEGYGVVTVGSRGFRAEKARVVALVRPSSTWSYLAPTLEAELQKFGVPVYDTVAEAVAAHPLTRPEDVGVDPPAPDLDPGFVQNLYFAQRSAQAWQQAVDQLTSSAQLAWDQVRKLSVPAQPNVLTFDEFNKLITALNGPRPLAPREWVASIADSQPDTPPPSPVERKRARAEAAADARKQAGLRGVGGFDRRGRRR